jgi:hypothetical protein
MPEKETATANDLQGNVPQFPPIGPKGEDANPAIRLFGRRFLKEQTEIEYLIEFLLLFASRKTIGDDIRMDGAEDDEWQGFPTADQLAEWPEKTPLSYYPKHRLPLKLFAFLSNSNLESRHKCHREKHEELVDELRRRTGDAAKASKDDALSIVEKVLVGFIGFGGDRTWCTHSFLPLAPQLICGETIWKKSTGLRNPELSWDDAWAKGFFSFSSHDFLCRGWEVLYLQLCNLFRKAAAGDPEILAFEESMGHERGTARGLGDRVENGLKGILGNNPAPELDQLADWVQQGGEKVLDPEQKKERRAQTGWCPEESWPEAYLFAYEMANICEAMLDPIEKIEMLKLCCIFQVLRTLSAQAARYWPVAPNGNRGMKGYAWIVSDPAADDMALKEIARWNLVRVQEMIHDAIRTRPSQKTKGGQTYKKGDEQATDLFVKLAKKIGFIVPYKGPHARFVLDENLTRYFVLALLPPGRRVTLRTFQRLLFRHYRAAFDGDPMAEAVQWTHAKSGTGTHSASGKWIEELLRATGFLIPLSDAVSLIRNPFCDLKSE